jgi:hypothetical protein
MAQSLYERLGGVYAIAAVVDDFIDRVMDNPRLNANPKVDEAHHRVSRAGFKYYVTEMVCGGRTLRSEAAVGVCARQFGPRRVLRGSERRRSRASDRRSGSGCGCHGHRRDQRPDEGEAVAAGRSAVDLLGIPGVAPW